MAITFKGFSSPIVGKTQVLYDQDLIRQDLLNAFNTRKGERAMDADYGFIGWDLIFELDSPDYTQQLDADARKIIALDPRVDIISLQVLNIDYGYRINITLKYVQLDIVEDLLLSFDQRQNNKMITSAIV